MKHLSNVSIEEYYQLNGTITDGHINELLDRAQKYEDLKTHIHAAEKYINNTFRLQLVIEHVANLMLNFNVTGKVHVNDISTIHDYLIDVRENFETDSDIFYLDIEE